jgi:hypothetical protein
MKHTTAWAIFSPSGKVIYGTIRVSRRACLRAYSLTMPVLFWPKYRKVGYRCMKVRITKDQP